MFEELIPTHTVPLQGEIINLLGNSEDSMQPQLGNSAPRPEHPSRIPTLNPAVTNASPDQMIPNQIPVHNRPTDERPHPTCVPKPSRAQVESSEYLKCEENAREAGKDWANDLEFPLVPDDEDPEDIIALKASEICNLPEPENKWTPSHYAEAMMKPDLWVPAMDAEIHRMEERDVWEVIPREPWMKLIDTWWVFNIKLDARLVVKGFNQIKGLHYFESFAVVIQYESLQMFFAIVAAQGLDFWLIDFVWCLPQMLSHRVRTMSTYPKDRKKLSRDLPPGDYVLRMHCTNVRNDGCRKRMVPQAE